MLARFSEIRGSVIFTCLNLYIVVLILVIVTLHFLSTVYINMHNMHDSSSDILIFCYNLKIWISGVPCNYCAGQVLEPIKIGITGNTSPFLRRDRQTFPSLQPGFCQSGPCNTDLIHNNMRNAEFFFP